MNTEVQGSVRPLLTSFAVIRADSDDIPGHYSPQLGVWVVDGPEGERPIIAGPSPQSTTTPVTAVTPVTKVKGERDPLSFSSLLETYTATFVRAEKDDTDAPLPELLTKTEQKRERDEQAHAISGYMVELVTNTRRRQEQDDR